MVPSKTEKYVRRKRIICLIFMPIILWCSFIFNAPAYAEGNENTDSTKAETTTESTMTTSVTKTLTTTRTSTTTTSTSTTTSTTTTSTTSTTTTTAEPTTTTVITTEAQEEATSEEIYIEEPVEEYVEVDTYEAEEFTETTEASVEYVEESAPCVEEEIQVEYAPGEYPEGYVFSSGYVKGSDDYIRLCNTVGAEYGFDYVSIQEKAKVAAVVINRVNSASFPNTVYGVLTQKYQFNTSYASTYYFSSVTESVKQAVDWYLDIGYWDSNYSWMLFYSGDGRWNYFRASA